MAINFKEYFMPALTVVLVALMMFPLGYMHGFNSNNQEVVQKANEFVQEYCARNDPLKNESNRFIIINGTIVFQNINI